MKYMQICIYLHFIYADMYIYLYIYADMYVYVYVYAVYADMHISTYHICRYVYILTHIFRYVYSTYADLYIYVYIYAVYADMCISAYYICRYVYKLIHICRYVYSFTQHAVSLNRYQQAATRTCSPTHTFILTFTRIQVYTLVCFRVSFVIKA